jgi:hypothetical protein
VVVPKILSMNTTVFMVDASMIITAVVMIDMLFVIDDAAPTADEGALWSRILNCGGNSLNEPSSP